MGIYEFDQEVYERVLREDSEAIGFEKGKAEGMAIGKEAGILNAIENLIDTSNMTTEQAMEALKIPKTEWIKYTDKLKK